MNILSLITGARVQRLAPVAVQPQAGDSPQASLFTLPAVVQGALRERLQTVVDGAKEPATAVKLKLTKPGQQDKAVPQALEALMGMLLTPERPIAAEKMALAAVPEQGIQAVLPAQIATTTPKQLASQMQLAAEKLPLVASLNEQREAPQLHRSDVLRHRVKERLAQQRPEPASPEVNHHRIADEARISPMRMQPERVISLDTRAAQWGEALIHMLKENIQFQIGQQQQISTIRLDPPSLGKLEIAIHLEAGRLTVHIGASQAEVCRTLQQSSEALRVQLSQQNFVQVEVQVSPDGQSQSQSQSQRQRQQDNRQTPAQIVSAIELEADRSGLQKSEDVLIKV